MHHQSWTTLKDMDILKVQWIIRWKLFTFLLVCFVSQWFHFDSGCKKTTNFTAGRSLIGSFILTVILYVSGLNKCVSLFSCMRRRKKNRSIIWHWGSHVSVSNCFMDVRGVFCSYEVKDVFACVQQGHCSWTTLKVFGYHTQYLVFPHSQREVIFTRHLGESTARLLCVWPSDTNSFWLLVSEYMERNWCQRPGALTSQTSLFKTLFEEKHNIICTMFSWSEGWSWWTGSGKVIKCNICMSLCHFISIYFQKYLLNQWSLSARLQCAVFRLFF